MKRLRAVGLLVAALLAAPAYAACLGGQPLRGVNIAGGEFNPNRMPGTMFKDYTYPSPSDLKYFAEQGANTIRMPFRWERVQRTLNGPLDEGELKAMRKVVEVAREHRLCVILDAHNFGTYRKQSLGTPEVPLPAFIDFWRRMHEAFPDPQNVAFGLMNEPARATRGAWARAAQDTVLALREAGAEPVIMVSGGGWSGAHDWASTSQRPSNAEAFKGLRDPLKRSVIEVHQYADRDHSGTKADCMPPERMRRIMEKVADWAREHEQRLFLGEFGVAPEAACLDTLRAQLESMRAEPWAGWAYWAAGAWWGPNYIFGVHPLPGQPERAQLGVLRDAWR